MKDLLIIVITVAIVFIVFVGIFQIRIYQINKDKEN